MRSNFGVGFDSRTQLMIAKVLEKSPERLEEAMYFAMYRVGEILADEVAERRIAPPGVDYGNLNVAMIDGQDEPTVAVFYSAASFRLEDLSDDTALAYVVPGPSATDAVRVTASFNPWPVALLPITVEMPQGRLVIRRVTRPEVAMVTSRLRANATTIRQKLMGVGVDRDSMPEFSESVRDLGFEVLRMEFGHGQPMRPHWRPALSSLRQRLAEVQKSVVEYIKTGQKSVFDFQTEPKGFSQGEHDRMVSPQFMNVLGQSQGFKKG